uniref:Prospero domain-containing protein n=1 Tax=Neogobius melanostomus TaxID=47308 RepID=A0A8C6U6D4_9GOBI
MPDHDAASLLSGQNKRRRVDIGVKRTVAIYSRARENFLLHSMNQSHGGPEQEADCSLVAHGHGADGEKSNVLRKLLKRANSYEDAMMPFPGATIISQLLKSNMGKNGGSDSGFQWGLRDPGEDGCSNSSRDRDSPSDCLSHAPSQPLSLSSFDLDRLSDEHLRAKRARVENIIRGMSHSPLVRPSTGDHSQEGALGAEAYRENKRKQRLPQQQHSFTALVCSRQEHRQQERRQLRLQLEDMQKQLRQLQEKFYQIYDSETEDEDTGAERGGDREEDGNLSEDSVRSDGLEDRIRDRGRHDDLSELDPGLFLDRARALLREQDRAGAQQDEEKARGRHLAETLKQELNCAVSQVVDTVVKGFSSPKQNSRFGAGPLGLSLNSDSSPTPNFHHSSSQRLHCFGDVLMPSPLDSFNGLSSRLSGGPVPNDQTEALPLVVRKTSLGFSPPSFRHPFPLPLMGYPFQGHLGSHGPPGYPHGPKDHHRISPDSLDMSRETMSLRTKMNLSLSHHAHRQSSPSHGPDALSLSLIKSECGDLQDMDISPYSGTTIQEGLSPNHLKKAKLMFFYTRYPSSNMLKMFFGDVKFNRCITSQLIKWFSNFREFYYIQMEKFARQAINEGVTTADELSVGRDAELFRALNMHYNKANDFQVPERFLEVSQVTLREFFNAIVAGKDADPSWKKAIYKVICKLDSEVPEVFKSPNCLQELLHD